MAKYDISWAGLDRGHEGLWRPDVWIAPLKALAKYSSVDYSDAKHAIYKELTRECPNVEWLSFERQSKTARSLFRDNREPWYSTGVITFVGTSMSVSPLGKQILAGELTYSQVLARAMAGWEEHGENPFAILSDVFLRIGAYRGLSFDDVVRIMQNFREGDDVCFALEAQVYPLSGVAPRRLKAILLLMVYSGAITCVGNVYFSSDRQGLIRISGSDKFDVDEFGLKIGDQSDDGAVTIIGADKLCYQVRNISRGAEGVRTISKKLLGEWVIAVKDDPTATAESLRGKLTGKTEVDKFEYGYFSTLYKMAQMVLNKDSIKKLSAEELSRLIKDAKPLEPSNADRLTIALKLFAERRLEEDWVALLKRDGYEGIRTRYEGMNPETLRNMTAAEFDVWANKELWALQHYRCKQTFDKLTDEQKTACARFVAAVKKNVQPVTSYFPTTTNCPEGVGPVVATELLMKFHPQDYMGYSALMLDGMKALKLLDADPQYDTAIGYQKTMGIASQILEKMIAMKLTRSFDDEKYIKPDYITVNEFLWWVKTHQDLIKEEIMSQKMKKPSIAIKAGAKTLSGLIGKDPDSMMSRLTAALLTKPFAILAGASGTGKSRMVRQLAYMTCLNTDLQEEAKDATAPGNYRLVQVKPNWHDSSDLLGYRSAINEGTYVTTDFVKFVLKAHAYPDTPFFVCLDEMNLAPVEQYFAEFLSASEDVKKADDGKTLVSAALIKPSDFGGDVLNLEPEYELAADRKALIEKIGLFIPHNLYVVGTVNMDDTTCQFSRKVLDRAMTIEMNEVKLETLQKKDDLTFDDLLLTEPEIKLFAERAEFDGEKFDNPFRDKLDSLRGDLESSPFAIAYRFAREAIMYREAIARIGNEDAKAAKDTIALDHMSLMKILPRITGTTTERKGVTDKLSAFFTKLNRPLSLKKLNEMIAAASGNGEYLSFWP